MDRSIGSPENARTAHEVVLVDPATGAPQTLHPSGADAPEVQGCETEDAAPTGKGLGVMGRYRGTGASLEEGDMGHIAVDSRGVTVVAGLVASGSPDSGGPVKVGGRYNAAPPILSDGQRTDLQTDAIGSLRTVLATGTSNNVAGLADNADAVATTASAVRLSAVMRHTLFNGSTWDRARGDAAGGAWVQGPVANGVAAAGNPVPIGGLARTGGSIGPINGQRVEATIDSNGNLGVRAAVYGVGGVDGASNTVGMTPDHGGYSASYRTLLGVQGFCFNGSTWDRQRGDVNGLSTLPGLSSTFWNYAALQGGISNSATPVTIKGAAGSPIRNYVSSLQLD